MNIIFNNKNTVTSCAIHPIRPTAPFGATGLYYYAEKGLEVISQSPILKKTAPVSRSGQRIAVRQASHLLHLSEFPPVIPSACGRNEFYHPKQLLLFYVYYTIFIQLCKAVAYFLNSFSSVSHLFSKQR